MPAERGLRGRGVVDGDVAADDAGVAGGGGDCRARSAAGRERVGLPLPLPVGLPGGGESPPALAPAILRTFGAGFGLRDASHCNVRRMLPDSLA